MRLIKIIFFYRYGAQSNISDDDLLHITHAGSSSESAAPGIQDHDVGHTSFTEEIPGLGQYDDFHTIDWQRDIARDRTRHRFVDQQFILTLEIEF